MGVAGVKLLSMLGHEPMTLQAYRKVCVSHEVADPGCHEFELKIDDKMITGFVVHWQGQWFGYENHCPHTGASLNWQPNQFFDPEQEYLMCGLHGALFQPQNGFCVHGPCAGQSLSRLVILEQGKDILLNCSGFMTI